MNPLPLILITVLLSAVTAYSTARLAPGDARAAEEVTGVDAAILARLEGLERRTEQFADELASSACEAEVVAPARSQRVSASQIEDAVARWMARHAETADADGAQPTDVAASRSERTKDLLQRLETGELGDLQIDDIWRVLRDEGLADEALAALIARAERNPDDAQAHLDLGIGYIHQLDESGGGPERGRLAYLADESFDRALEIDDHNWTARFYKATSLSHWPAFLGKQAEAIQHFEILRTQQEGAVPNENHAQTYFYLGNLYQQAGEYEKAKSTWQSGFDLFPDNPALAEQLNE